jgi:hypothetical protein
MAGYFVCGFQVMFIGVHMPSYLKDFGMPHVASYSLALVGLFNIFGTYWPAIWARSCPSAICCRASTACARWPSWPFCWPRCRPGRSMPSAAMGFLWLSTVPLTNATIAQIFGVQHLSMLGGFVFFSHQIGSFLGVWLGGYLYDINGNYDMVWYLAIALGIFAAVVNLPVREQPLCAAGRRALPPFSATIAAMRCNPLSRPAARLAAGAGLGVAAVLAVFALYLQPDFMVTLANQVWACF